MKCKPCSRLRHCPVIIRQIDADIIEHVRPPLRRLVLHTHRRDDTDDDIGEHEEDARELQEVVESGERKVVLGREEEVNEQDHEEGEGYALYE